MRVMIAAGEALAPHSHPGPQFAVIVSGTLTYTVIDGEVKVIRESGTDNARSERVESGNTVELEVGDWLQETPGTIHRAENRTNAPVVMQLISQIRHREPSSRRPVNLPVGHS